MELSFEMLYTLKKQLFSNGVDHTCDRWNSGLHLLLNSGKINHLWIDKDFRNGFDDATRIANELFNAIGEKTTDEDHNDLIEKIADEILYPGNPEHFVKLIEGILAILPELDETQTEDAKALLTDFKMVLILCRLIDESCSNDEKFTKEMEAVTLGELDGPEKAKRRHLMEAA